MKHISAERLWLREQLANAERGRDLAQRLMGTVPDEDVRHMTEECVTIQRIIDAFERSVSQEADKAARVEPSVAP